MKLIVQPDDGAAPLIDAIGHAQSSINIVIFRFDVRRIEDALQAAVKRGVTVQALIAHTNRGGEKRLRKLERRMLEAGVTVARTNDDMVRYHGKVMIVDRATLFVLGFNYTGVDLKSRSFGVVTKSRRVVQQALALFEADATRHTFTPQTDDLVISPENARERLARFIQRARHTLDVYDPRVTDDAMIRLLKARAAKDVRVRILGTLENKWACREFDVRKMPGLRLHVRAIIRDGRCAFVGSQSLRKLELDERREVGLVVRETSIAKKLQGIFDRDWQSASELKEHSSTAA